VSVEVFREHESKRKQAARTREDRTERKEKMTLKTTIEQRIGSIRNAKALAAGLLLAAMMTASLMTAAPAHTADTFTVDRVVDTPDVDVGDGDCDVTLAVTGFQCTLRAAIQEANATPEADLIRFAILDGGTGVKTIEVGKAGFGALPPITHPVTIDGYTQPGASPNTKAVGNDAVLKIELNGTSVGGNGLELSSVSSSVIKGLAINRFLGGITIFGDSVGNRIEGNFIGTDPSGTVDRGNKVGLNIVNGPSENVLGGTTPAARNVISGNDDTGIFLSGSDRNRIEGNYVGTDKGGTKDLGNLNGGVLVRTAVGNTVGGTTSASRNVVSGNGFNGVTLFGDARDTKVLGNRIGTTANGTGALGNAEDGVLVNDAPDNSVGDGTAAGSNVIAFNGQDGVGIVGGGSVQDAISRNSIFSNSGLGIDLNDDGPTPNDPGDADSGPNSLQNKPVLSSAATVSGKTTVKGKLNSAPDLGYVVQFYSNPSGNEGKKFLGQKLVSTDGSGNATFVFSPAAAVAVGQTITATATDRVGNASEFSAPKTVALASGAAPSPETLKVRGPSGVTKNPTAHFEFASSDPRVTFECSLDGRAYHECSSPENINRLSEGRHTFLVRAVDEEGTSDPSPAAWIWSVDRKG
jgi:CSLREA domain-containing protein